MQTHFMFNGKGKTMTNPTHRTYNGLNQAYEFFNQMLFSGTLPHCLITMQRKQGAYGYFAGGRFGEKNGTGKADEIALNPSHFRDRTTEQVLSTLVHEMAHLWQHHHGKAPRTCYHDKQWAAKMKEIGLMPSSTGAPGGKETGQRVSHYIIQGGPFDTTCGQLMNQGFELPYIELWGDEGKRKKKAASKTKYTCPSCGMNAWGKPDIHLVCGDCEERLEPEEG